ncbi:MAG: hypothetical protein HQ534_13595 [Armatimonadetes bacterium]|nr:hypothetical protein [Armatimonadota bacterium]
MKTLIIFLILFFPFLVYSETEIIYSFQDSSYHRPLKSDDSFENFYFDQLRLESSDNLFSPHYLITEKSYRQKVIKNLESYSYINNIDFFYEIVNFVPFELYDKYYLNDIYLTEFFGFMEISLNLQRQYYLRFQIPYSKLDYFKLNKKIRDLFESKKK